jgi:cephalosporin hydroxylase
MRAEDPQYPVEDQLSKYGFAWDSIHGFGPYMNFWGFYQELVQAAPRGSTIVEVGCFHGQSLVCLGLLAKEANKGLAIVGVDDNTMGANEVCRTNLDDAGLDVSFIEAPSVEAAEMFEDRSCWAVFIDGGHLHDIVEDDVRAWMPKVEDGGWMAGHDFTMYTVHQPVLNLFPTQVIFDPRWDDVWIVRKSEPLEGVNIRTVPEKYPDRKSWNPRKEMTCTQ